MSVEPVHRRRTNASKMRGLADDIRYVHASLSTQTSTFYDLFGRRVAYCS